ncbi:sigma-70 family RNA polymerase sigma factor [Massilibacteroides sp.]|uniref:sigma-70 family RNA polymerase sigma factor n=1 Tax=Massilibacteroides sp. TaxID=2034766 RepID=UPI00261B9695|nr:sigma-70 family RNA polymerase sigma factor [Massilibacteroides sp.]MDD4516291.1 sigma-70 family RNA polymerase sigma factor [Massilibacteroides sp.]
MNLNKDKSLTDPKILYEETVKRFWPRLFKFCCIYIADEEAAKDITQDVFLSLWESQRTLTDNMEITPYLMVACRNRCLNYIRSEQRKISFDSDITKEQILLKINKYALEDSPSILLESSDLRKTINEALSILRPRTQEIFNLRYYDGFQINEIAKKTQLTRKVIEYHLSKAINELQKKLSPKDFLLLLLFIST